MIITVDPPADQRADSAFLADLVAVHCRDCAIVLDVASGDGSVGLSLLEQLPQLKVIGIEIDGSAAAAARARARDRDLGDRYSVLIEDAFRRRWPSCDAIACNPPLLPNEPGFTVRYQGREMTFLVALLHHVIAQGIRAPIYAHVFTFWLERVRLGGASLRAEVAALGYEVECLETRRRGVRATSRLLEELDWISGLPSVAGFAEEDEILTTQNVPHAVVRLRERKDA